MAYPGRCGPQAASLARACGGQGSRPPAPRPDSAGECRPRCLFSPRSPPSVTLPTRLHTQGRVGSSVKAGFVSFFPGSFSRSELEQHFPRLLTSARPSQSRTAHLVWDAVQRGPGRSRPAGARPVQRQQSALVSGLTPAPCLLPAARCLRGLQVQVAPNSSCKGPSAESVCRAELPVPSVLLSRPICVSPQGDR